MNISVSPESLNFKLQTVISPLITEQIFKSTQLGKLSYTIWGKLY